MGTEDGYARGNCPIDLPKVKYQETPRSRVHLANCGEVDDEYTNKFSAREALSPMTVQSPGLQREASPDDPGPTPPPHPGFMRRLGTNFGIVHSFVPHAFRQV